MVQPRFLPLACLVALATAQSAPAPNRGDAAGARAAQIQCPTGQGVGVMTARGTTERLPGALARVAQQVQQQRPGSTHMPVDYPATMSPASPRQGIAALAKMAQDFGRQCRGSRIALVGYSQGAVVAGDVACGGSGGGGAATAGQAGKQGELSRAAVPAVPTDSIVAVVLMGDPRHSEDLPNPGTSTGPGSRPRTKQDCAAVADRIMSICDAGDPACNKGGKNMSAHMAYVTKYGAEAARFIVAKAQGAAAGGGPAPPAQRNTGATGGRGAAGRAPTTVPGR